MTFTIAGYCSDSGRMGFATSSSTPAVGWRPAKVVLNHGIVVVQALGDYRKLLLAARLMAEGHLPAKILKDITEADEYVDYRQIAILDLYDRSAVFTGEKAFAWGGALAGQHHVVAANAVVGEEVTAAMSEAFLMSSDQSLEERLMRALEAARDAGGQAIGQLSAGIVVHARHEFPAFDLRIDAHAEPIGELRRLFDWYKPLSPYYEQRTLEPPSAPRLKDYLAHLKHPELPGG